MITEVLEGQGITGYKNTVTIQEAIAIKDKWSKITREMPVDRDDTNTHRTVRVKVELMQQFDSLVSRMLSGVQSTKEVHDILFNQVEQDHRV
jgi:hypothetical protein